MLNPYASNNVVKILLFSILLQTNDSNHRSSSSNNVTGGLTLNLNLNSVRTLLEVNPFLDMLSLTQTPIQSPPATRGTR